MTPYHKIFIIVTIVFGWLLSAQSTAVAQIERLELGRRLQRFEIAWETATAEQRAASARPMQTAVSSFFALQLKSAAQKLDEAWLLVRDRPTADWQRKLIPYYLSINPLIVDHAERCLAVSLKPFYKPSAELTNDYRVKLQLINQQHEIVKTHDSTIVLLSEGIQLPMESFPEGDYRLRATIFDGPASFELIDVGVSLIENFEDRIDRLREIATDGDQPLSDSVRATVRSYADLLAELEKDNSQEIDYPAARILGLAEALANQPQQASQILQQHASQHDTWLTLRQKRRQVPLRVRAPKGFKTVSKTGSSTVSHSQSPDSSDSDQQEIDTNQTPTHDSPSLPVLILLHGAGGSENMFFETYGAGRAVQLGLERNWLVVAPRQGSGLGVGGLGFDTPEIVDSLAEFFPVDRNRVYLIGHSMGAGQVIRQATQYPDFPAAVAAIGGGSGVRNAATVAQIPWFVSAGELDFGLRGARALKGSLESVNAPHVQYQVYPNIEHMVIVQASLDDVFAFFDQWPKPN